MMRGWLAVMAIAVVAGCASTEDDSTSSDESNLTQADAMTAIGGKTFSISIIKPNLFFKPCGEKLTLNRAGTFTRVATDCKNLQVTRQEGTFEIAESGFLSRATITLLPQETVYKIKVVDAETSAVVLLSPDGEELVP